MTPHDAAVVTTDVHTVYAHRLARKIIAEFCHERILHPIPLTVTSSTSGTRGTYLVLSDDHRTEYVFEAQVLALDNWLLDEGSLRRIHDGVEVPVDPLTLLVDVGGALPIAPEDLPAYLEEFVNTLSLGADRAPASRVPVADLAVADFQTIEQTMTEGHPCIVANAGRIGFSSDDIERYAPECGPRVRLLWVAVRRDRTEVATVSDVDLATLLRDELGTDTLARFDAVLGDLGLAPESYHYVPVHPWQWSEKITRVHAVDITRRDIVLVGHGPDEHQPQQSIRTLFNISDPSRHYVKVSLSITNMGFTRGMSADYMRTTPLINDWVRSRVTDDPYLRSVGFEMLYEVAAVGYRSPELTALTQPGSEYRKLLSALWRQSPVRLIAAHEQLTTMAALLHVDHLGDALIEGFVATSGLDASEWIRRYLRAYLHPVAHLLYRHGLKFSPHGENLILVLDRGVPVRAILKDIGEEVSISGDTTGLPESCLRAAVTVPDDIGNLGILSDVFDDFLRPLAAVVHGHGLLTDRRFWELVAQSIHEFQSDRPELAALFARWDLFAPTFGAIGLNRLQLGNRRRMVDIGDSYAGLVDSDHRLTNPIAQHAGGGS